MAANYGGSVEGAEPTRAKACKSGFEGTKIPQICLWCTLIHPPCSRSSIPGTNFLPGLQKQRTRPIPHGRWSIRLLKFVEDRRRNHDPAEQTGQSGFCATENEVV